MNEKKKRFSINKGNLILSIIISLVAWIYVIYNIDPTMTKTYDKIPVQWSGVEHLKEEGLAIADVDTEYISITASARRNTLDNLSIDDINVTANFSKANRGNNNISLNIDVPSNVQIKSQSKKIIKARIGNSAEKTVGIEARYSDPKEKLVPAITKASVMEVTITGAESQVKKVTSADLILHKEKISDEENEFTAKVIPSNKNGEKVNFTEVNPKYVTITAVAGMKKTVPLKIKITNPKVDNIERKYKIPKEITIIGTKEKLDEIEEIEAEDIDLTNIYQDVEIPIELKMPKEVMPEAKIRNMSLKVKVDTLIEDEIYVPVKSIKVKGLKKGRKVKFNDSYIPVYITVYAKDIEAANAGNLKIYIDASDAKTGDNTGKLNIKYNKKIRKATLKKEKINFVVE